MKKDEERHRRGQEFRRNVESSGYETSVQTEESPSFNHPEIRELYEHGIRIDREVIEKLLELPRESLVEDLEAVLEDSIRRYEYFFELETEEGYRPERVCFPVHALFLLGELQAEESLDQVLRLLRQGEELLNYWFDEHNLVEVLWPVLFKIGPNKLDQLADFVKEPNNATFARALMGDAVSQLALHKSDRRPDVLAWFEDVFQFFLDNKGDERLIDTQVISLFVWHAADINAVELEDLVGKLYENDFVEVGMVGPYQQVVDDMMIEGYKGGKLPVGDIWEEYDKFIDTREGGFGQGDFDLFSEFEDVTPPPDFPLVSSGQDDFGRSGNGNQPFESSDEPGRNDPCLCGSGRKYKHCCME